MNKSNTSSPIIATSNGWTPIEFFDFGSAYAEQDAFLVWMVDGNGYGWFEIATAEKRRIVSEPRNVPPGSSERDEHGHGLHPVAFKLIEGPDRHALRRILNRGAPHFSPTERRVPKLKFVINMERSH